MDRDDSIANVVSWLERVTERSLGDVRIHDSAQAGQLARRLGARAFTAGRDIYVRPELVEPMTPEGAALLAHELYHVAEQSGAGGAQEAVMPLLRPLSPPQQRRSRGQGFDGSAPAASIGSYIAPNVAGAASQPMPTSIQRATGGQSGSEAAAESVAAAAAQAEQPKAKKRKAAPLNPEVVADIVYRRMVMDLLLERERGAY